MTLKRTIRRRAARKRANARKGQPTGRPFVADLGALQATMNRFSASAWKISHTIDRRLPARTA